MKMLNGHIPDGMPEGTVWLHRGNGLAYVLQDGDWVLFDEDDGDSDASNKLSHYIGEYIEPTNTRPISPNHKRCRGRPKVVEKTRTRAPSDYNVFIQTEMLKGTFANLKNGQERLTAISQLFKKGTNTLST